jgi:hypothetical protein
LCDTVLPDLLDLDFCTRFGNEFWCANVSNSPTCHSESFATPFTVIVPNIPGIDAMLQKS